MKKYGIVQKVSKIDMHFNYFSSTIYLIDPQKLLYNNFLSHLRKFIIDFYKKLHFKNRFI